MNTENSQRCPLLQNWKTNLINQRRDLFEDFGMMISEIPRIETDLQREEITQFLVSFITETKSLIGKMDKSLEGVFRKNQDLERSINLNFETTPQKYPNSCLKYKSQNEGSEQFSSRNFYLVNHNAYFLDDGKNSATLLLDRGERSEMRDYKLIPSNDSYQIDQRARIYFQSMENNVDTPFPNNFYSSLQQQQQYGHYYGLSTKQEQPSECNQEKTFQQDIIFKVSPPQGLDNLVYKEFNDEKCRLVKLNQQNLAQEFLKASNKPQSNNNNELEGWQSQEIIQEELKNQAPVFSSLLQHNRFENLTKPFSFEDLVILEERNQVNNFQDECQQNKIATSNIKLEPERLMNNFCDESQEEGFTNGDKIQKQTSPRMKEKETQETLFKRNTINRAQTNNFNDILKGIGKEKPIRKKKNLAQKGLGRYFELQEFLLSEDDDSRKSQLDKNSEHVYELKRESENEQIKDVELGENSEVSDQFDIGDSKRSRESSMINEITSGDSALNNQSSRGPYKKYSISLKKKLVSLLDKGESIKELSQKYDIPIKNLQRWNVYGAERREGGGRKIMDLNMEVILLEYCIDYTLRGRCRCPRKLIMQKAREFTKDGSTFKGSKGWLDKYSSRTGLSKIMSLYKQMRVYNESEIFRLVKSKSVSHVRHKMKSINPLRIFTSSQYLRFLNECSQKIPDFWNISILEYAALSREFQSFLHLKEDKKDETLNIFHQALSANSKESSKQLITLSQVFGLTPGFFRECLIFKYQSHTTNEISHDQSQSNPKETKASNSLRKQTKFNVNQQQNNEPEIKIAVPLKQEIQYDESSQQEEEEVNSQLLSKPLHIKNNSESPILSQKSEKPKVFLNITNLNLREPCISDQQILNLQFIEKGEDNKGQGRIEFNKKSQEQVDYLISSNYKTHFEGKKQIEKIYCKENHKENIQMQKNQTRTNKVKKSDPLNIEKRVQIAGKRRINIKQHCEDSSFDEQIKKIENIIR